MSSRKIAEDQEFSDVAIQSFLSDIIHLKKFRALEGSVLSNRNLPVSCHQGFHVLLFIPPQPKLVERLPVGTLWRTSLLGTRCSSQQCYTPSFFWFFTSVTLLIKFSPRGNFSIMFLIDSVRFTLTNFD